MANRYQYSVMKSIYISGIWVGCVGSLSFISRGWYPPELGDQDSGKSIAIKAADYTLISHARTSMGA
jgi:hypothetical protein